MDASPLWDLHVTVPDAPIGFTVRTSWPTNPDGVECMLERWVAGSYEVPHTHPGNDMTVVVEGQMQVQFYQELDGKIVADGSPVLLNTGDAGYVSAGRIHDARYIQDCKLVYVHERAFDFVAK